MVDEFLARKGTAVPRRLQPHDGEADWQHAQEKHREKQRQVEVVGPRRPEEHLVRHVARQHRTRAQVENYHQLYQVQGW